MLRKVAIKNLRPNPFRRLDEYPIQREKVEALKSSIENSGFWKTIVGRQTEDGLVEIAFGHHRWVALQELFGPDDSIEMVVEPISDEDMLRMMANENLAEWGADGWVEVETIRATIEAFCDGKIRLPEVPEKTRSGYARHVVQDSGPHAYTMAGVAQFLGWTRKKSGDRIKPNFRCETAFGAIDAIDDGIVKASDLRGLPRYKIQELIQGARSVRRAELDVARQNKEDAARAKEQAERAASAAERNRLERRAEVFQKQADQHEAIAESRSKDFVEKAVPRLREKGGHEEVREMARQMAPAVQRTKEVSDIDGHADQIIRKLANILNGDDSLSGQLSLVKEFRGQLSPKMARDLAQAAVLLRLRLENTIVKVFSVD